MGRILLLTSILLGLGGGAPILRAVDFDPDLAGRYRGNLAIFVPGSSASGRINGKVAVPPGGKRLRLQLLGRVVVLSQSIPVNMTVSFGPGRRVRANSVLLGYGGPTATLPSGFRGSTNISTTVRARPGARFIGADITGSTADYRFQFSPRRIRMSASCRLIANGGMPQTVTMRGTLSRRGD